MNKKEMAIARDQKMDEILLKLELIMKALKIKEPNESKNSKKA